MAPSSLIVEEAGLCGPLLLPPGALAALALPPRRRPVKLPLLPRLTLQVAVDLQKDTCTCGYVEKGFGCDSQGPDSKANEDILH